MNPNTKKKRKAEPDLEGEEGSYRAPEGTNSAAAFLSPKARAGGRVIVVAGLRVYIPVYAI